MKLLKLFTICIILIMPDKTYSQGTGVNPVAEKHVYKTRGLTRLRLYIIQPVRKESHENLPAIIFFHGGGLKERMTWEFVPQAKYLVERGMVVVLSTYSIERHGRTEYESIADAKSAIRWIRKHAKEQGIDENHIAAGGGSAGGYLAACTAMIKDLDEKKEDLSVSSVPNALVLFNPRLVMSASGDPPLTLKDLRYLNGRNIEGISPFHNIYKGAPPTIIFQGTDDSGVQEVQQFCEKMKTYGNTCEVDLYEGRKHGFFHYFHGNNPDFLSTMENTVKFLSKLGYISKDK